ncbi:MAG: hypothetical protein U9Q66_00140 [Patescibacteria group bacterium]|nr:hypothetical protein [Patescibacteria group bacterium]
MVEKIVTKLDDLFNDKRKEYSFPKSQNNFLDIEKKDFNSFFN